MTAPRPAEAALASSEAFDALVIISGLLTGLAMTGLTPVLPRISGAFGANDPATGYLVKAVVAVVGLSIMLAAPLSDWLARRFSAGRLLTGSFLAYAISAVATAAAPSLQFLVAARFVQGLAVAIGVTLLLSLTTTLYDPPKRNRLLGLHMGCSALALFGLLPLAGVLGEASWRLAPLLGLVSLVHLALAWRARGQLAGATVRPGSATAIALVAGERGQMVVTAVLSFLIGVALYSPSAFVPFKLTQLGVTSSTVISLFGTLAVATSASGSLGYAAVARRLSTNGIYLLALLLCALASVTTGLAETWWPMALAQLGGGVGGGLMVAHIYADNAGRFRPELRGRATGLIKSSSFAGLFVGPLSLQAVVGRTSLDMAFLVLAGVTLAGLALALARGRRATPMPREAHA